ncbi:hypothetical protein QBC34DRAFT_102424 [Podospora aff. communis PSN243]|uniref:Fucose-specific lectin n=1 Tax=Podospora aff. communis PSN243 TaxID=3040156 RepID=A0AAV9GMN7_9PEZI|nr:hypothetical protein QBC34DRAFT_102424 [Podospora aff. communis PSN243]
MALHFHEAHPAQAGLEVAPQDGQPWLEVRETLNLDNKEVVVAKSSERSSSDLEAYLPASPSSKPAEAAQDTRSTQPKRRRLIISGVLVVLLVVVAAVLGGVLGSRVAATGSADREASLDSGGGDGAPQESPTARAKGASSATPTTGQPSATPATELVRRGSALSVTGMRKSDGGLHILLFYQDNREKLRYSQCDTRRLNGGNGTCWGGSTSFSSLARPAAQFAASSLVYGSLYNAQTELFYTGENSRLLGCNINSAKTPPVGEDSVNAMDITTGTNSSLAAYWPWTIYQDSELGLHHVRNQLLSGWSPASAWDNNKINVAAIAGSKLAIVPMSSNFSRIALKGGYAVFYQARDGHLAVHVTDLDSPELDPTYPLSWPTAIPSILLPPLSPIAAFSVARPQDKQQRVDTHVLYLDASSNINVLYTRMSSSGSPTWRTSQPAALQGVDPDTSIACLNMATSPRTSTEFEQLLEEPSESTNRCYFQRGGRLVEARYDGADWVIAGEVPLS